MLGEVHKQKADGWSYGSSRHGLNAMVEIS